MDLNNDKPSFLDRNTWIALLIVFGFWMAWSWYMERQYPKQPAITPPAGKLASDGQTSGETANGTAVNQERAGDVSSEPAQAGPEVFRETVHSFSDKNWSFEISSRGMGLRAINVEGYQTRTKEPIILGAVQEPLPFSSQWVEGRRPIDFTVERVAADTFVGRASSGGVTVEKTMKINSSTYSIDTVVKVTGLGANFSGVETVLSDRLHETTGGSFLAPSYDHQEWFLRYDGSRTRSPIDKDSGVAMEGENVEIVALSGHYFALAVVDRSPLSPRFAAKVPANAATAVGSLIYRPVSPGGELTLRYTSFAGPKKFDLLSAVDDNLTEVIDFGIFAFIAKPILWLLKALHSMFGNWGWAIIVLTIIVRLILLPFNVVSYRSMKVMQKIQPEMARIRERYKDAPADKRLQMNQEIMELMKRHKANPLGGCLPMLLQLPVFLALYQVLGQSIELYQAPFVFWIDDLSAKDPFYVLPVLMGVAMFVQQRITPTTMDPQQAKIMMWMPVIFALFMVSLPSGLTLYIFVSTLFGIIQQFVLMRDKSPAQTVNEAQA